MISDKIKQNKVINSLYKGWFYFDLGRNQMGKITNVTNELSSVIIILTLWLGFDLKKYFAVPLIVLAGILVIFTTVGFFYHRSGLFYTERQVVTNKDPISHEIYTMAKRWNDEYKTKIK